jgi:hypothetical protein
MKTTQDEQGSPMRQLSLYSPPAQVEDDEPRIYSFADYQGRAQAGRMVDLLARVRVESQNRQCPCCRRAAVEPLELSDALRNRNGARIPGTATIVAFRCNGCRHEWPVRHPA